MTNEQKAEAYLMRLNGATLQEIGDHFGLTRECIRKILPAIQKHIEYTPYNKIIYPNIAVWMAEEKCTYKKLADKIQYSPSTVRFWLVGMSDIHKRGIDKILGVTGFTYEEAFAERKEVENYDNQN